MTSFFDNNSIKTTVLAMLLIGLLGCESKGGLELPIKLPADSSEEINDSDVAFWLSSSDRTVLFDKQNQPLVFGETNNANPSIKVDPTKTFQSIDGFGYSLTGGSAILINSLPESQQDALLEELFLTDSTHIGVSYLRISIGASDLSATTFTYDDVPAGETDMNLEHFSIERERANLIPVLKNVIKLFPDIKIMGSPWSPPTWMKTNNDFKGGSLKPEYYAVYAQYFVKYIQAMAAEGIKMDAITIQNEPLHPGNTPSLLMYAEDQADFIKNHLGPAFEAAEISTKIVVYDHNADRPDYPLTILDDPEAAKYVDGSAFHLYGGSIDALTQVHNAHPDKNIYFTEQWVGANSEFADNLQWHTETLIIGATRNWSRNVLEWNLAANQNYEPHTNGGCTLCKGAITIAGASVSRNVAYYIIAHASKFVRPGSVRIGSNMPAQLPNVAFKTPDGKKVLIVLNKNPETSTFNINFEGKSVSVRLKAKSVGTFVW